MADFDAKSGNYAMALDWLGVAAQHRQLTPEYQTKKTTWETVLVRPRHSTHTVTPSRPPRSR
jgi:hypothetical protein